MIKKIQVVGLLHLFALLYTPVPSVAQPKQIDVANIFGDTSKENYLTRRGKVIENLTPAQSPDMVRFMLGKAEVPSIHILPSLASEADLSSEGLGKGMYLPIDLRSRISVYEMEPRQSQVLGLFITDKGMFAKRVTAMGPTRVGNGSPMRLEIIDSDGKVRLSGEGKLVVKNALNGSGYIELSNKLLLKKSVWVLWSCIDIEK